MVCNFELSMRPLRNSTAVSCKIDNQLRAALLITLSILAAGCEHSSDAVSGTIEVDGDKLETTPFAHPIALVPGKHFVVLKHPRAPEEQRSIVLAP